MHVTLEQILSSPQLPHYFEVIRSTLEKEKALRGKFYEQIQEQGKWEFINGEVILQSPASARHCEVRGRIFKLLSVYVELHELGAVYDEKALISLTRNDYEPDVCFFKKEKAQKILPSTLRFPVPDLVVEVISPGTEKMDRGIKFQDYASHGIEEYWIVDGQNELVEQYCLNASEYCLNTNPSSYRIESRAVPGFSVPRAAFFGQHEHLKSLRAILGANTINP